MRYGTVVTLFRGYSHDIIMNAINTARSGPPSTSDEHVKFLFAGGLFGVLAAVNEAVEDSYWMTLVLVISPCRLFLYFTYGSLVGTLILMIPVLMSQFACEAFMYLMNIDLNVNSLPVAAAGAGVGVDYGIYHFSRMIDLVDEGPRLDEPSTTPPRPPARPSSSPRPRCSSARSSGGSRTSSSRPRWASCWRC